MASARHFGRRFGRSGRVTYDHPARDDPAKAVTAARSSSEQGAMGARSAHGRVPTSPGYGAMLAAVTAAGLVLVATYVATERRELVRSPSAASIAAPMAPTSLSKADRLDTDRMDVDQVIVTRGNQRHQVEGQAEGVPTSPGRSLGLERSLERPGGVLGRGD